MYILFVYIFLLVLLQITLEAYYSKGGSSCASALRPSSTDYLIQTTEKYLLQYFKKESKKKEVKEEVRL